MELRELVKSRLGLSADPGPETTLSTLGGTSREAYDIAWALAAQAALRDPSWARAQILLALLSGKVLREVESLFADLVTRASPYEGPISEVPAAGAVEEDGAPTPLQGRIWQSLRQNPSNASLNIVNVWTVEGQLDVEALRSALHDLVMRHDIFLYRVVAGENGPKVGLREGPAFLLRVWDFRSMALADQKETLDRLVMAYGRQAFDLQRSRSLRVLVVRITDEQSTFVLVTHHFQCDGTAMAIMYRDLCQLYEAHLSKAATRLDQPSGAYAEHRRRSRAAAAAARTPAAVQSWRDYLKDATWGSALPGDKGHRRSDSNQGKVHVHHIQDVTSLIEEFRASAGVSNAAIFLAALAINLQHHARANDAVIGVVVTGRANPQERHIVAPLINTVPVRLPARLGGTYSSTIEIVALSLRQALAGAELSLGDVLDVIKPTSDRAGGPISILFLYQDIDASRLELKGTITTSGWRWDNGVARSDLTVEVTPEVTGFRLDIEYSTELYSDEFIGVFAERLETVLKQALRTPHSMVRRIGGTCAEE